MSRDWIDITPAELSYLCDAPEGASLLMANLFAERPILGSRDQKELGRKVWDERTRAVGGVDPEVEAHVGLIAHILAFAAQGSVISIRGQDDAAALISAVVDDLAAQMVVTRTGTGTRLIAWPPAPNEFEAEVLGLVPIAVEIKVLRVGNGVSPAGFEWRRDMGGSLPDAVHNACLVATLALESTAPRDE